MGPQGFLTQLGVRTCVLLMKTTPLDSTRPQEKLRKETKDASAVALALQQKIDAETLRKKTEDDEAAVFNVQEKLRRERD